MKGEAQEMRVLQGRPEAARVLAVLRDTRVRPAEAPARTLAAPQARIRAALREPTQAAPRAPTQVAVREPPLGARLVSPLVVPPGNLRVVPQGSLRAVPPDNPRVVPRERRPVPEAPTHAPTTQIAQRATATMCAQHAVRPKPQAQ